MPEVSSRLGLGLGLDLPWGAPIGFAPSAQGRDLVTPNVIRFIESHASRFAYLFVSWQPRDRNWPEIADYVDVYDNLFSRIPNTWIRALHHTALNLGALEPYDRVRLIEFTNELIDRFDLAWVNEDLGLWSIQGRPLPYPLPPYLTREGLAAAVENIASVQGELHVPLVIEFPGFSEGTSFVIGDWHAFDFFREVAQQTQSPVTLDTGHLLSYQWMLGRRGRDLLADLDRLPLEHCFEIHLSGCETSQGVFHDYHHGVLLDAQLELLELLLERCPNLRAVTYEDPKFSEDGCLIAAAVPNFERLAAIVASWAA